MPGSRYLSATATALLIIVVCVLQSQGGFPKHGYDKFQRMPWQTPYQVKFIMTNVMDVISCVYTCKQHTNCQSISYSRNTTNCTLSYERTVPCTSTCPAAADTETYMRVTGWMFCQGIKYMHIKILGQPVLNYIEVISSSISIWQCMISCNERVSCTGFIYSLNASCAAFDIAAVNTTELELGIGSEIIYLREDLVNFD